MVGSELSRIRPAQFFIPENEKGKYLGTAIIGEQSIGLSPKLNAIIGGRGSGKSALLDRIALSLDNARFEDPVDEERIEFLRTEIPAVTSLSGTSLSDGSFRFDYFDQSYVSSLFQNKGEAFNKKLKLYFGSAFDQVEEIKTRSIESEYSVQFNEQLLEPEAERQENLIDFIGRYVVDQHEKISIKFEKAPTASAVKNIRRLIMQLLWQKSTHLLGETFLRRLRKIEMLPKLSVLTRKPFLKQLVKPVFPILTIVSSIKPLKTS